MLRELFGIERGGLTLQNDARTAFDHTKIINTSVQAGSQKRFKLLDGQCVRRLRVT